MQEANNNTITVVHIVENMAEGVGEFIRQLIMGMPNFKHHVIFNIRDFDIEATKKRYPTETTFHLWKNVTREISPLKDLKAARELYTTLKSINYDVIHLHSSKGGFLGRIAGLFLKNKNIFYSPNGPSFARLDVSANKKKVFVFLEKFADKLCGQVVAASASEARMYEDKNFKVSYVNNGLPVRQGDVIKNNEPNPLTILTVGRLTAQKNPTLFNEIAEQFVSDSSVKFIWIGEGEERDKLTAPNIEVTGWVDYDVMLNLLDTSDVYLSTALWEGLPLSVIEAMQSKLPLVLHHCIGNTDLVKDQYNGYVYKTLEEGVEAINKLKNDADLMLSLGINSKQFFLDNFSVDKMIKSYQHKYLEIAGKSK
ncbi:MAG: glycosyltransferase involved in cell wall biosynthesis [Maribacter sp.]|jgi:glycosyltransferase involved in cell wall biosynthesis